MQVLYAKNNFVFQIINCFTTIPSIDGSETLFLRFHRVVYEACFEALSTVVEMNLIEQKHSL